MKLSWTCTSGEQAIVEIPESATIRDYLTIKKIILMSAKRRAWNWKPTPTKPEGEV